MAFRDRRMRRTARDRRTTIVSSGWLSVAGSPPSVEATSWGRRSGPPCAGIRRRAPASWPGVRIVTATATGSSSGPAARISSGASPTMRSGRTSSVSPRTATIGAGRDVAGRRDAGVVHARSVGPGAVGGASLEAPMPNAPLDTRERAFLVAARWAILATIDPDGRPRPVPICFIVEAADPAHLRLLTPLDDKPKAVDDKRGARPRPRHPRASGGQRPRRALGRGLDPPRLAPARRPGDPRGAG